VYSLRRFAARAASASLHGGNASAVAEERIVWEAALVQEVSSKYI